MTSVLLILLTFLLLSTNAQSSDQEEPKNYNHAVGQSPFHEGDYNLPFSDMSTLIAYVLNHPQPFAALCMPEHRDNFHHSIKIMLPKFRRCVQEQLWDAIPKAEWHPPYNVPQLLGRICKKRISLLKCYKTGLQKTLNLCYSTRGLHFGKATKELFVLFFRGLCESELKNLLYEDPDEIKNCLASQFFNCKKCFEEFASYVDVKSYISNEIFNMDMCSSIYILANCIRGFTKNCNSKPISLSVMYLFWYVTERISIFCPNMVSVFTSGSTNKTLKSISGKENLQNNVERKFDKKIRSKAFAKYKFKGNMIAASRTFPAKFSDEVYKFFLSMQNFCRNDHLVSLYQGIFSRAAKSVRKCFNDIFEEVFPAGLFTAGKRDYVDPMVVVDGLCTKPRDLLDCFDTAAGYTRNCFNETTTSLVQYVRNFIDQFLYTVCYAENKAWMAAHSPVLGQCLVFRWPLFQRCTESFVNKFLEIDLKSTRYDTVCFNTWHLLECFEDNLVNCNGTEANIPISLHQVKKTLVARLHCPFPYNAEKKEAIILKDLKTGLKDFTIKQEAVHAPQDICVGHGSCRRYNIYDRGEGLEKMAAEMDQKLLTAKMQLNKILETAGKPLLLKGPLVEFLDGDFREFYKAMFQYCPEEIPSNKYYIVEQLTNSTLNCVVERVVDAAVNQTRNARNIRDLDLKRVFRAICESKSSLWSCYSDSAAHLSHCYSDPAQLLHYTVATIQQTAASVWCSDFLCNWKEVPRLSVHACFVSQFACMRACTVVFGDLLFTCARDSPAQLQTEGQYGLRYSCYGLLPYLECLEDCVHGCGVSELSYDFIALKWSINGALSCPRNRVY